MNKINNSLNKRETKQNIIKLYSRLFGKIPENKIKLILKWNDLIKLFKESNPSEEEKEFFINYYKERQRNINNKKNEELFTENIEIDIFELIEKEDKKNLDIAEILGYLGPRIIHEKYGEVILFYVWDNIISIIGDNEKLKIYENYIISNTKLIGNENKYRLLKKAKLSMWQLHLKSKLSETLAIYEMFLKAEEYFKKLDITKYIKDKDFSIEIDYSRNISSHGKSENRRFKDFDSNGECIDEIDEEHDLLRFKNLEKFNQIGRSINWEGKRITLFIDSPIGIILKYKGKPVAISAFSLEKIDIIHINQFQQVPYQVFDKHGRTTGIRVEEIIKKTDWQNILYNMIYDFGVNCRYKKIIIQSGERNKWTKTKRTELGINYYGSITEIETEVNHLSKEIAEKVYDIFAQKNHFTRRKDKNWGLKIKKIN